MIVPECEAIALRATAIIMCFFCTELRVKPTIKRNKIKKPDVETPGFHDNYYPHEKAIG